MEKTIKIFNNILVVVVSFFLLYQFFNNMFKTSLPLNYILFASTLLIAPLTFFIYKKKINTLQYMFITYIFILVIWTTITQNICIFYYHAAYISVIFISTATIVIYNENKTYFPHVIFIIITLAFLYILLIKHVNLSMLKSLTTMNRNRIPMYLLIFASLIYITDYCQNVSRPVIWPSIITLILSTLSLSRAGTLFALILFLTVLFLNLMHFKVITFPTSKIKKYYFIFLSSLIVILIFFIYIIYDYSRFSSEPILSHSTIQRMEIYRNFFDQLTPLRAITGFKPGDIPIVNHFHNSYLVLWSYTGIGAFPVFIFIGWLLKYYYNKSKLLFMILLLFLLYSITDWRLFFRQPDLIFYTLSLLALKEKRINSTINQH